MQHCQTSAKFCAGVCHALHSLRRICLPFNRNRLIMYLSLAAAFIAAILILPGLFSITMLDGAAFGFFLCFLPLDYLLFRQIFQLVQKKTASLE